MNTGITPSFHYQSTKVKKISWKNTNNKGKTAFRHLPKITAFGDC